MAFFVCLFVFQLGKELSEQKHCEKTAAEVWSVLPEDLS